MSAQQGVAAIEKAERQQHKWQGHVRSWKQDARDSGREVPVTRELGIARERRHSSTWRQAENSVKSGPKEVG